LSFSFLLPPHLKRHDQTPVQGTGKIKPTNESQFAVDQPSTRTPPSTSMLKPRKITAIASSISVEGTRLVDQALVGAPSEPPADDND
jgi:hypothetical protein